MQHCPVSSRIAPTYMGDKPAMLTLALTFAPDLRRPPPDLPPPVEWFNCCSALMRARFSRRSSASSCADFLASSTVCFNHQFNALDHNIELTNNSLRRGSPYAPLRARQTASPLQLGLRRKYCTDPTPPETRPGRDRCIRSPSGYARAAGSLLSIHRTPNLPHSWSPWTPSFRMWLEAAFAP